MFMHSFTSLNFADKYHANVKRVSISKSFGLIHQEVKCVSVCVLLGEGLLVDADSFHQNQMATLKLLLAQSILTSALPQFPPFPILFFMRFA